jgi:hypothetical protein
MFTRALSQLSYNKGDKLAGQWRAGAGYVCGYKEKDELKYLKALA